MPENSTKQVMFLLAHETPALEIWRVEVSNRDQEGGCEVALFSGPQAKERAVRYAKAEYGVQVDPAAEGKIWRTLPVT